MFLVRNFRLIQKSFGLNSMRPIISPTICKFCSQHRLEHKESKGLYGEDEDDLVGELVTSLGCSKPAARHILSKYPEVSLLDQEQLSDSIIILKEFCKKNSIIRFPLVLCLSPVILHNRIKIIEESTLRKSVRLLYNLNYVTKLPVYLLKAYRIINDDSDVVKNLLSEVDDVAAPLSPPLSEKQRLDDLYVAIMKNYMKNKFNLQPKELDALKITRRILKDFSLNQLKRNINFLINVAGFSKQMVLDNFNLIRHMNTPILYEVLNVYKERGYDIRKMWKIRPKLLKMKYSNLHEKIRLLEDFKVSHDALMHTPEVFNLPISTIRNRLEIICKEKELSVLRYHSRFLELLLRADFVMKQLQCYRKLGYEKLSLSLLMDYDSNTVFIKNPPSSYYGQSDVLEFLSQELQLTRDECKAKMERHPFSSTVPLAQIDETLRFLESKDFSREEIVRSFHLLLYPRIRVEFEMTLLGRRNFTECRQGTTSGTSGNVRSPVKREFVLPLVLYFIEKGTKFSGDGVWIDNALIHLHDGDIEDNLDEDNNQFLKSDDKKISSNNINREEIFSRVYPR